MSWLSQNFTVMLQLLPGFITAAVFYAFTAHPKASEFERTVQALIFTLLLKVGVAPLGYSLILAGKRLGTIGRWDHESELVAMVIFSGPLGLLLVYVANKDICHSWMRRIGLTTRSSYPSEWYGVFTRERRWIVLHLDGGRRLYGWAEEWPDRSDKGHFVIRMGP